MTYILFIKKTTTCRFIKISFFIIGKICPSWWINALTYKKGIKIIGPLFTPVVLNKIYRYIIRVSDSNVKVIAL